MKILKSYKYGAALTTAVLSIVPFAAAQAASIAPAIVTRNCSGCHGMDGQSQLPYVPRLAGQNAAYLERKLANFHAAASSPVDEVVGWFVQIGKAGKSAGITL